jgi:hypothetical protein
LRRFASGWWYTGGTPALQCGGDCCFVGVRCAYSNLCGLGFASLGEGGVARLSPRDGGSECGERAGNEVCCLCCGCDSFRLAFGEPPSSRGRLGVATLRVGIGVCGRDARAPRGRDQASGEEGVLEGRDFDNPRRQPGGGISLCVAPTGRDISRRIYFDAWQVMVSRPVGAEREADATPRLAPGVIRIASRRNALWILDV